MAERFLTLQRLDQHVNHYMPFYNSQRIHSALGYVYPSSLSSSLCETR